MTVDFQKLQNEVSETRQLVLTLLDRLNSPASKKEYSDELLTVGQAANLLNLTTATVYGMVYEKRIPFSKPSGSGRLYFVRSELIEWVKNGRKATSDELDEQARQQISSRITRRKQSKDRKGGPVA
ncbi:helix-turn-helix domain-containing protein [Spirosoma sp. KNUC1025]|uniref:helix-turn-helix domain-containing protein n=1 Tax=Spirosoma sp. KNUC1025 TaxID=2894082 RepID=UPI0038658DFA|nr:helix-turn-helix domain-containing protein [Spirosoma sp. KNUC1025]